MRQPRLLRRPRQRRRSQNLWRPTLQFSPTAWAQLLFLRDRGDTEIGGFGIADPDNLLRVVELGFVGQVCSPFSVAFDDMAVAEFFDAQIDAGRKPENFARLWMHTHPGDCSLPSSTDEATFARVFGRCDWAVMFILARGGQTYARLQWNTGPGGACLIPVEVDYSRPFGASDQAVWEGEYQRSIIAEPPDLLWESWGAVDRQPCLKELVHDRRTAVVHAGTSE